MTIFVKQYGYLRTGTNYLRALLDKNCDCFVCINHLGSKHKQPMSWEEWLGNPDKEVHPDLPGAVRESKVRVAVIVKDPYGWLDSFLLYWRRRRNWPSGMRPRPKHRGLPEHEIINRIGRFNRLYPIWDEFAKQHMGAIVRYEDLLSNFDETFTSLAHTLDVPLVQDPLKNITGRVDPHPNMRRAPFRAGYFLNREYLDVMSDRNKQLITDLIDWDFFGRWNYGPVR